MAHMKLFLPLIPILLLLCSDLGAAQVRINEVVSSNVSGISDEDGNTSDWIELWNYGASAEDVGGWGLSDDPSEPFKWTLPAVTIPASSSLLVRASGKGEAGGSLDFVTLVQEGDTWDYWPGAQPVATGWEQPGFSPTGWAQGPSGLGFGDGDDATTVNEDSIFLRIEFPLTQNELDSFDQLFLHVDYDDGFIAYLNGVEIDRENMSGSHPPHTAFADASHEAELFSGGTLAGKDIGLPQGLLLAGNNVLAVQVHNVNASSSDISIIPFLTAARASATPTTLDPRLEIPGYRPLHTNFKLKAEGESLVLTDTNGALIDALDTGRVYANTSVGRDIVGANVLTFQQPTPEALNTSRGRDGYATGTTANPPGGLYPSSLAVTLSVPPGGVVHYSLNGEEPTTAHPQYSGPITILAGATPLRARAFENGKWGSRVTTETYLVGPIPQTLPIASVVTEPDLMFAPGVGIYTSSQVFGDDEIPAHVEYFELGGSRILSQDIGLKIHGGFGSRTNAQRSLRVIARGGYSEGEMTADLFPELGFDSYKQFLLRNGGNDWCYAHMRDGLMHRISEPEDLEVMAFQPTIVLINGEYYGIHNLRERQDEDYLATRKGVDPDEVDILELRDGDIIEGSSEHWEDLLDLVRSADMNDPMVWADVESRVDTDNLATYCIMQVWGGNDDWPQNNVKWWRPRTAEGRWRWMLYDTDFVFGRYDTVQVNVLNHLYNSNSDTAEMFRALMENDAYRIRFINRYADYLNEHFLAPRTRALMFEIFQEMNPEMGRHTARWRADGPFGGSLSRSTWIDQLQEVSAYLGYRNNITRQQVLDKYNIPGTWSLSLDVSPAGSGSVQLTAISVDEAWSGEYFQFVPVTMTAAPAPGWEFDSWSDPLQPTEAGIEVVSDGSPYAVTAIFRPSGEAGMVLREINYNSSSGFDPGDWVELYNNSTTAIDLSDWTFSDSGSTWTFPSGTVVASGGTVVLAEDLVEFTAAYGTVPGAIGDLGFGLSGGGELLQLRDAAGLLVDEVDYDDDAPWPTEPDGNGPTLELTDPNLDNNQGSHWQASSSVGGSPGG